MKIKITQLIIIFLVLPVLVSCSRFQFAYQHLDWIIPYYIEEFITLNDDQQQLLDKQIHHLQHWHCQSQLSQYVTGLKAVKDAVNHHRIDITQVKKFSALMRDHWDTLVEQTVPDIITLFNSLTDQQIEELFQHLEQRNTDYQDEYIKASSASILELANEEMVERLENWIGDLTEQQTSLVTQWSGQSQQWFANRYDRRIHWQNNLRSLLTQVGNKSERHKSLYQLLRYPQSIQSANSRLIFEQRRQSSYVLIHQIYLSLSKQQNEKLQSELSLWVERLSSIECETDL